MIADKLYPSFYLIEFEDEATSLVIPGDFGIKRIAIGSRDYPNDMLAYGDLERSIRFAVSNIDKDMDILEEVSFNPEFFPTLKPIELTDEQKEQNEQLEEYVDELRENLETSSQVVIPLTNTFDPIGDFVTTRWEIVGDNFCIEGRVAVQPQYYLLEKRHSNAVTSVQVH